MQSLIQEELDAGFIAHVPGGMTQLKQMYAKTAIGKLEVVLAPGRSPRLAVDSSISIVTANTVLPNYMLPLGCFTVRFTFAILTLARVSLSVSPFFSPLSLRRGVVVVCFEVIRGELLFLSACAM